MYLIERLIGLGIYVTVLIMVCNGISVSNSHQSVRRWLFAYAVMLGIMGFFYVPAPEADLYRLRDFMHSWSTHDFSWLVDYCSRSSTPAWIAYAWLIGKTGIDGLLPGLTGLIHYALIFSCMSDYAERDSIAPKHVALSLAVFMSMGVFVEVISGIRSSLALASIFWYVYGEVMRGKNPLMHSPVYLVVALIHSTGIFLVLVRFIVLSLQANRDARVRIVYILICIAALGIIFGYGQTYIDGMLEKAESYGSAEQYAYIWEVLIRVILLLTCRLRSLCRGVLRCVGPFLMDSAISPKWSLRWLLSWRLVRSLQAMRFSIAFLHSLRCFALSRRWPFCSFLGSKANISKVI